MSRSDLDSLRLEGLPLSHRGSPTWELALNHPFQGEWSEGEYLSLDTNRLIEFTEGVLEFLPNPKPSHARLSRFISDLLRAHVTSQKLGDVFWAPFSIRIGAGRFREPDILYLAEARIPKADVPPDGADLVVEIVSEGTANRDRDLRQKRSEYAAAGIPEYWIVDPLTESIVVLVLTEGGYQLHGEFGSGSIATSVLLPGFQIDVAAAFAAARPSMG